MAIDLIIHWKKNQDIFEDQRVAVLQQALLHVGAQIRQWSEVLAQHQIAALQAIRERGRNEVFACRVCVSGICFCSAFRNG